MLKRLFAGFGRKAAPATALPPVDMAAWQGYEARDYLPPHDFSPVLRHPAACAALAAFNTGRFGAAAAALEGFASGDARARECVALLRAHAWREELRFADALAALDDASPAEPPSLRRRALRVEVLHCLGRFSEAREEFARMAVTAGTAVRGHSLLGALLADAGGDAPAAIDGYRRSLAEFPQIALARSNLGYALIRSGAHREGYAELRRVAFETGFLPMERGSPVWAGEPLDARPLLLVGEFGLGDMVQFLRYAGVLRERVPGTPLWLKAPATLHRVARSTGWFEQILAPASAFDQGFHTPLMQLPALLGIEADLRPLPFPYLSPPPFDAERFAKLLGKPSALPLIGLCWAGKAIEIDARRSVPLTVFAPLLERLAGKARVVSLQTGAPRAELTALPAALRPLDLTAELTDVAATLALVSQLDLVLSVDTAAAHIAGSLGAPVWLLSRPDVEWRWETRGLHDGQPITGFYPQTRVFRHAGGDLDWNTVLVEVEAALSEWLARR